MRQKVLIIKLGYSETLDKEISEVSSLGDILRTTIILHCFKESHVTWLVDAKAYPLLEGNPYISRILIYNLTSVLQLQSERFDTIINFEKVPGICAMADSINGWRRLGFRFDEIKGEAQAYDSAERIFYITQDKKLKKQNTVSLQQSLIELVDGKWENQEYILNYEPNTHTKFDIGLNWAVGIKWPNKAWPEEYWKQLEEIIIKDKIYKYDWQKGLKSIREYIDWINSCKLIVTNDSLGFHLALALKKRVIVFFGPTSQYETYLYNRGTAMVPDVDYDCIPCFEPACSQKKNCTYFIKPEKVYSEIVEKLKEI